MDAAMKIDYGILWSDIDMFKQKYYQTNKVQTKKMVKGVNSSR